MSLFTWTGVIGVMLAGTALGNLPAGMLADRVEPAGAAAQPAVVLAGRAWSSPAAAAVVAPGRRRSAPASRRSKPFDDAAGLVAPGPGLDVQPCSSCRCSCSAWCRRR